MNKLKGKNVFTMDEIKKLEELIKLRNKATPSEQKSIRGKMRNLGFYGKDDWDIIDLQISDLHSLINSNKIKIIGNNFKPNSSINIVSTPKPISNPETSKTTVNVDKLLDLFKSNYFDPTLNEDSTISNSAGNYIICLRKNSTLPPVSISPILTKFEGLNVIYTGIASGSLRTRDFRYHFKGNNAGRSTLRKSLGVLFGYTLIPRDKDPNTGKTKFSAKDEQELTEWMLANLVMFYHPTANFSNIEITLINHFNPPLNIKDNHSVTNSDYRHILSNLRTKKTSK
jgi:hypothetical protein